MPGKIKSSKQFRFLEAVAHGSSDSSMPQGTAGKMLADETHATKSNFAKALTKKKKSPFPKGSSY